MKENRLKKVFTILLQEADYYPVRIIASQMGVSEKTIIRDIETLRNLLSHHGAEVVSKPSRGYKIQVKNAAAFENFLQSEVQQPFEEDLNSSSRRVKMIVELLLAEKYQKAEDICNLLGISRSTFNLDIKQVKKVLEKYHLLIQSRPYYGMWIVGAEEAIRELILEYLMDEDSEEKAVDKDRCGLRRVLERIVLESIQQSGCWITEFSLRNLIDYLSVSLNRVKQGHIIEASVEGQKEAEPGEEIVIAGQIVESIDREFGIHMSSAETIFLERRLLSEQISRETPMANQIPEEIDQLLEKILTNIKDRYHIDFTSDLDMRISLGLHVRQMVERAKCNLSIKNPVLYEIKNETFAYELATFFSKIINEECNVILSEHEIGYIAMYLGGALLRINQEKEKKNILIVCGTGNSTAMLLKNKFEIEFSNYIAKLDTCDAIELRHRNLEEYQLLVSTVPIHLKTDIPIINISPVLKHADTSHIRKYLKDSGDTDSIRSYFPEQLFFTHQKFHDKQELLFWVSQKIGAEKGILPEQYYQELLSRERLASTELDKKIAIPHPLNTVIEETFITVIILEEPLLWDEKMVQLVVLLNINPVKDSNIQVFYNAITDLISNEEKVSQVLEAQTLETFVQILTNCIQLRP